MANVSSGGSQTPNTQYDAYIYSASAKYGVDPQLIKAVIKQESGGNASARSGAGAIGLMQLMPSTAQSLGVSNPYDAGQNIDGGTKYLSQLLKQFNGNVSLALAGYNAGAGAVQKYGGIPPYAETQNYVRSIEAMLGGQITFNNAGSSSGSSGTGSTASTSGGGFAQSLFGGILETVLVLGLLIVGVVFFMKAFDMSLPSSPIPPALLS